MRGTRSLVGSKVSSWLGAIRSVLELVASTTPTTSQGLNQASSSTSFTALAPADLKDGDLIIVVITYTDGGAGDSITVPSGWTLLDSSGALGSNNVRSLAYWKIASGEGSSWTWTDNTAARRYFAATVAIRGVDQNTPIDTSSFVNVAGAVSSFASGSITPSMDGCFILYFMCATFTDATNVTTPDAAFTEHWEIGNNQGPIVVGTARVSEGEWKYQAQAAAISATATNTQTQAATSTARVGIIAVRPKTTLSRA